VEVFMRALDAAQFPLALCLGALCCLPACSGGKRVSGTVVDDGDGRPIAGARVTVQATDIHAVTDELGAFVLDAVPGGDVVVVGASFGWYNGSTTVNAPQRGVEIRLQAVPEQDDPAHVLMTPADCGSCHGAQVAEWRSSAMSHAGNNQWVYDVYDGSGSAGGLGGFVYVRDSVHAASNPSSECASCHQPLEWLANPFGAMAPLTDTGPAVNDGVTCVVCHQIGSIDLTQPNAPGLFPGVVSLSRPSTPGETVMYGLLGDVDFVSAGQMRAAYNPELAAGVCAACHQDANDPDGDHNYDEPGSVISEPTYLEWRDSVYADPSSEQFATCIDCHMPRSNATLACILPLGYERAPGQLRSHAIEGTTPRFLENAVTLDVVARRTGDDIEVDVTVTNDQTGHHVPTGVTIRNMVLLVEVLRSSDDAALEHTGEQVVHALGGVGDPAQGYFAGLPGKLYAKFNHGEDGSSPVFFTEATGIREDNRIAPLASDTTHYTFRATDTGDVRVRARLIYRRTWRALLDAKQWNTNGHGGALADIQAPDFGHLMEATEQVVPGAAARRRAPAPNPAR
jgi:mono/diheme cytochrome c family protein